MSQYRHAKTSNLIAPGLSSGSVGPALRHQGDEEAGRAGEEHGVTGKVEVFT